MNQTVCSEQIQARLNPDPVHFSWTIHPASNHPLKAMAGLFVIGMILGLIYQVTGNTALCAVGLGIFLITLSPFYQKTKFSIDESGVSRTIWGMTRMLEWHAVQRTVVSKNGVYLSRRKKECWNDRGGIYLMFGSQREEVLARLQTQMGKV